MKNFLVIFAAIVVIALPFIFRHHSEIKEWQPGDPTLVIISPHNEAIRYEFGEGFSRWHREHYGKPVKVDWRVIGGTTEIMRYLCSEFIGSCQAWWKRTGHVWPTGGGELILSDRLPANLTENDSNKMQLWQSFRNSDAPGEITSHIDILFGGGSFDHEKAARQGLTVKPWRDRADDPDEQNLKILWESIPTNVSGEAWRSDNFCATVLSSFGICYNPDRLADLGITKPPANWRDLTSPRYFGQLGVTDPTKSGSVAKAFEMIVQEQCRLHIANAGYSNQQINEFEKAIEKIKLAPGELPETVPYEYQEALEQGWIKGINLLRMIGANARYFTDGAGRVPVDVASGAIAAGVVIDFYGRYQSEFSRTPDDKERLVYITPIGGSSVSADPISLLRGAPHREIALRFIQYTLEEDGQKLWNYRPGTSGGPQLYALRRLPVNRNFYPSTDPAIQSKSREHRRFTSENLRDPGIDPYRLAKQFEYHGRWTGAHFGIQRDIVRAICLDSGDELRAAWRKILENGGPSAQPKAMELLKRMPDQPVPLTWRSALTHYRNVDRLEYLTAWTAFSRTSYRAAAAAVVPLQKENLSE